LKNDNLNKKYHRLLEILYFVRLYTHWNIFWAAEWSSSYWRHSGMFSQWEWELRDIIGIWERRIDGLIQLKCLIEFKTIRLIGFLNSAILKSRNFVSQIL